MVPYYGWHCAKQFINGKPVRQGYIIWSLFTSTGAGVTFKAYCGHKQELRTEVFEEIRYIKRMGSENGQPLHFISFARRIEQTEIDGTVTARQNTQQYSNHNKNEYGKKRCCKRRK